MGDEQVTTSSEDVLDIQAAEVFRAALDRDDAERAGFLDDACGADTPLRARVEALLRADQAAGGFLGATAPVHGLSSPHEPAAAMIGRQIGRYRIDRLIGCGGMGAVYEATQEFPRRSVALKLMRSSIVSASTLRRFEYEAQVLARLRHPGVVQIYEAGMHAVSGEPGGVPYFAMEFIPAARSILEFARERDLRTPQKLELFCHVCDAVHHGHQMGVIHRDLKPGNILVDAGGQPKVIDFGVARAIGSDLMVTTLQSGIGQIIGTLRYMSPEQCDADPLAIDVRSDVYALGVVLYELLTGRLPYDVASGPVARAIQIIREAPPQRLSTIDRALRGDIDTIVLKCLAKERGRRYSGVGELAEDIRRYLDRRPIAARPPTLTYQLRTFARRNKVLVGGIVGVLASLVAGIIGTSWGLLAAREQARAARFEAYLANVTAAGAALEIYDTATARQRLDDAPAEYRNWEWRYLNNHVDASVRTIRLGDSDASVANDAGAMAFSSDGQFLALCVGGAVRILRFSTGETVAVLAGQESGVEAVAWSPTGDRIATADCQERTARAWNAASGQLLQTFRGHIDEVNAVAFSPDGLRIATGSRDYSIKLWDAHSGACLATLRGHQGEVRSVAFSPDGARLASGSYDHTVRIWDLANTGIVHTLVGHTDAVRSVEFDKQGGYITSAAADGTVRIWDVLASSQSLVLRGPTKWGLCAVFSPDGRSVATGWSDRTIRMWDSSTGELISILHGHSGDVRALAFPPDGKSLASGANDATIKVWDPATAPEPSLLRGHPTDAISIAFSPNGKVMASAGVDTTVRLWDTATGEETAVLEGHHAAVYDVAFSRDGSMLASSGTDHTVRIWDPIEARELRVLRDAGDPAWGVLAFDPHGLRLGLGCPGRASFWDLTANSEAPAWQIQSKDLKSLAFSDDGALFLDAIDDTGLQIWHVETRELVRVLSGKSLRPRTAAFSPDDQLVALVSFDNSLRVWDVKSGAILHVTTDLKAEPDRLAFYPDAHGSRFAISFHDGTIKIWDTSNWRIVATLRCEGEWLNSIAFDPQGRRLACSSANGTIHIWDAEPFRTRTAAVAGARALREEAEPIVARLFAEGKTRDEVMADVAADKGLRDDVRGAAIRLVRTRAGRPEELFHTAWELACDPHASPGQHVRAATILSWFIRGVPNNRQYLTALGAARFRSGDNERALAALTRAHELDDPTDQRTHAAILAFLSMVQVKLGDHAAAEATLNELHQFVARPTTHADESVAGFVEEAESLVKSSD